MMPEFSEYIADLINPETSITVSIDGRARTVTGEFVQIERLTSVVLIREISGIRRLFRKVLRRKPSE